MFGWELFPGFDYYIWVDASMSVSHPDCAEWFVSKCEHHDIAVFRHPDRKTVREEYEFVKEKLEQGNKYLSSRYEGEWLDAQAQSILSNPTFRDENLYASTAFVYKPNNHVKDAFREWWWHKSRYLLHDQLAFPYVLDRAWCNVNVIEESYLKIPYLTYARNK